MTDSTDSAARYEFLSVHGCGPLICAQSTDALTAFRMIKQADQDSYWKFKRFTSSEMVPEGFSALDIGYGLSLAYKRTPLT